jgi:hypothetical protein
LSFIEAVVIPIGGLDFYLASRLVIEDISTITHSLLRGRHRWHTHPSYNLEFGSMRSIILVPLI